MFASFSEAECPGDKVFTRCGSACPRTCDNRDELTFCTLQCVGEQLPIAIACLHTYIEHPCMYDAGMNIYIPPL